jgi:peptidoglycan/xylan/chitin deacetylase (PgdA/CDA1 family)
MQCKFVFTGTPAAAVARRLLDDDMSRARFSPAARLYYRLARPLLPRRIRHLLQRGVPRRLTESWYLPEAAMQAWRQSLAGLEAPLPIIHPWPRGARFALALTHDVDSGEGLSRALRLAELEEELGLRSSFNLVPYLYPIDEGIVHELESRGFEIGIHGYNHDGRLYASERIFRRRATAINEALRKYRAVGFRSPMVHRNLEWLQGLEIDYDGSCFDVDPLQPMPGGVGGLWPFLAGRFVELPYTLPQDHSVWIVLRERDNRIWERKLQYIALHQGMAMMLTHPDYMTPPSHLELYRRFLKKVTETNGYWHALPREVAAWWRDREASVLQPQPGGGWRVAGPAEDRAIPAELCLADDGPVFQPRSLSTPSTTVQPEQAP